MISIESLSRSVIKGHKVSFAEAEALVEAEIFELLYCANRVRQHFKGDEIKLCSVVNAKSGHCQEDCKFCAQSSFNDTSVKTYPLIDVKDIKKAFEKATLSKARCFGVVTSGRDLSSEEVSDVCSFLFEYKDKDVKLSCSLGALETKDFARLKKSGASRFHHNLETAESFFPNICSTHDYKTRIETIRKAKEAGLEVCSGGIFGLGEGFKERIEMAFALRGLDVDSVPLNFLTPIKGTPLENQEKLKPLEILRIIALFRFVLPGKDIGVCGGREVNLGDLQSYIFYAGANGMMVGNYLTTQGRPPEQDLKMIEDLGLKIFDGE